MQKNDWLFDYKQDVYSQRGEDGIIKKIFEIIGAENKYCVEFGAWDGKYKSNAHNLIKNEQWSGVCIEANRSRYKDLLATYKGNNKVININKLVDFTGENTLDNILSLTDIPINFDLISIDIDGNDYHMWDSLEKYRPRVVIIEFNPSIPTDIKFIQSKNMLVNQGSSLLAICNLAKKKGYELVSATILNAFFVRKELFDAFNIENNSVEEIFKDKKYYTRLFHLYDGTIVLHGYDKLSWHGIIIKNKRIQQLPKYFRIFPENMGKFRLYLFKIYRKIKNSL